jgi:hypothetical protein
MNLIPAIGAKGTFALTTPWSGDVVAGTPYTVKAIRRMDDIIRLGVDPWAMCYEPKGLALSVYQADAAAGACIISLQSDAGQWIVVPSTYITSFPNANGIPYHAVALAVTLSAIPDSLNLASLKTKIAAAVHDNIGVTAQVFTCFTSDMTLVSLEDHTTLEAVRATAITDLTTDHAKYLAAVAQVATLTTQKAALEAYIKAHLPP